MVLYDERWTCNPSNLVILQSSRSLCGGGSYCGTMTTDDGMTAESMRHAADAAPICRGGCSLAAWLRKS
jgi:hypothetical protein